MSDGKAHSKLGASSYYRWKACPGSVPACEGIPNESSVYAEEGTLAHDLAANILQGNARVFLDDGMEEAVNVYLDFIASLRAKNPVFEAVEQRIDLSAYHPALFGTADYVAYFSDIKTLHVVDYKHGAGIPVEVVGSEQLLYYGLGALHQNKFPVDQLILTIVQPRCYHPDGPVRSWAVGSAEVVDFAADLIDDALATEASDAPINPGPHCRFCPAQPTCPAVEKQALIAVQAAFSDVQRFDPDKLAHTLTLIPQIKAWCESVHEFAYQQASLGHQIPGFKLVDKRATRRWVDGFSPQEAAVLLGLDVSHFTEAKLKSPAMIEKLLRGPTKKELDTFTVKESSGKTLVPALDDRSPVKGTIETMFVNET